VGASSVGPIWRGILANQRTRLAADKGKGAAAALAYYDAFLAEMAGEQSGAMWLYKEAPYLSGVIASPLKDAAGAGRMATALAGLDSAAAAALLRAQIGKADFFDWSVKKENVGKTRALHYKIKLKKVPGADAEPVRKLLGTTFDVYTAVVANKIVVTIGKDARSRLAAQAAAKKAAPETSGPFADAAKQAKGRDAFYYFDFGPLLTMAGSFSKEPRANIFHNGSGPIPMTFSSGGDGAGKIWTVDLTIPVTAFKSVAALWQAAAATPSGQSM
jgi:hypothetical protein